MKPTMESTMRYERAADVMAAGDLLYADGYRIHHTASARGYEPRTGKGFLVQAYEGRFGTGYIIHTPRWDTTNYHYISYYIKDN